MNQVQVFQNQDFGAIRTVVINNQPWFVGVDVAKALGYKSQRMQLATMLTKETPPERES